MTILKKLYRSRRLRGVLRLGSFLAVINLLLTVMLLPSARAQAEQAATRTGLELLKQLGPALVGPPQVATINGQRMSLASKLTPLSVEEVLQRFERNCQEHSTALGEELRRLPGYERAAASLPTELRDPSRWLTSTQRAEDGKAGQVACIARRDGGGGFKALVDQMVGFVESGDLSKLGDARYAVARRDPGTGQTHVLAMWTEEHFNIPAMFPASGDAPGTDPAGGLRPPASKRVLSAELEGHAYALRMYDSERSQEEVLLHYDRRMSDAGWRLYPLPRGDEELDLNDHVRAFSKDGAALIVVVQQTPDEKTGVTLIEMGSSGFSKTQLATVEGDEP